MRFEGTRFSPEGLVFCRGRPSLVSFIIVMSQHMIIPCRIDKLDLLTSQRTLALDLVQCSKAVRLTLHPVL